MDSLKRRERLSARLGDILSQLYLASSVIKYYQDHNQPSEDLPFIHWALGKCLSDMQYAFNGFTHNLAPRWVSRLLGFIIFPWHKCYPPPADSLEQQMAAAMMHNSPQRERLTQYCYVGKGSGDAVGLVETTLVAIEAAAPALAKMQSGLSASGVARGGSLEEQITIAVQRGILSADEVKLLQEMVKQRWDAVQVDEFKSL